MNKIHLIVKKGDYMSILISVIVNIIVTTLMLKAYSNHLVKILSKTEDRIDRKLNFYRLLGHSDINK